MESLVCQAVGCVRTKKAFLFRNEKRLRIYDMEGEEAEEDETLVGSLPTVPNFSEL